MEWDWHKIDKSIWALVLDMIMIYLNITSYCDCSGITPKPEVRPKLCWDGFQGMTCKKDGDCGMLGSCQYLKWTNTKYVDSIYLPEPQIKQTKK